MKFINQNFCQICETKFFWKYPEVCKMNGKIAYDYDNFSNSVRKESLLIASSLFLAYAKTTYPGSTIILKSVYINNKGEILK